MTVGEMLTRNANKFPTKKAVVSEETSIDFKTLYERVNRLANGLLKKVSKKETGLESLFTIVINSSRYIMVRRRQAVFSVLTTIT